MPMHPTTAAATPRLRDSVVVRAIVLIGASIALALAARSDASAFTGFASFDLYTPAGQGLEQAVVAAGTSLKLGPGDRILAIGGGSPGAIVNAGVDAADPTILGPGTVTGAIVSVPSVVAGPRVAATSVTSSGTVTAGANASLGAVVQSAVLTPLARTTIIAHAPDGAPADVAVRPGGAQTLAPGAYRSVTIGPKATVLLSPGTYIVDQFTLSPDAVLRLDTGGGTIELYVRESVSWKGKTAGEAGRLVLGFLGTGELALAAGFRGTVLVPSGTLALGPGGPRDVFEGTFYGKHVVVGPNLTVKKLALPPFGGDLEGCAARVPVRTDLPPRERDVAYQADIARFCSAPGSSSCRALLIGRTNVDYTAAAARLITGGFSPAEYLAVVRDRTRKLRAAEDDGVLAALLCSAADSDGDGVPDVRDQCASTPDLTATDDSGCPLATLPPAPSAEDVARVFAGFHLAVNPRCQGAPVPSRIPAGAFYWPAFLDRGTYILSGEVQNQPAGCPIWYEFDIQEIGGPRSGERYSVVFMDREAHDDLVELGRPVPEGYVQFNPRPGQPGGRDRLATTGGVAGIRYRVRAVNGNGVRGLWSDYKISDRASCTALGFECGGG